MKIIKRNGSEAAFDIAKISTAITKANMAVDVYKRQGYICGYSRGHTSFFGSGCLEERGRLHRWSKNLSFPTELASCDCRASTGLI